MKLDVHILILDTTPKDVVVKCINSIEVAANNALFETVIHKISGIYGHLGKARALAYSYGEGEYVTHVDDDDWVEENAFSVLPLVDGKHTAITTGENEVHPNGFKIAMPNKRHHLAVFKRDWLVKQNYAEYKYLPDKYILSLTESHHIMECVYNYNLNPNSAAIKLRRENHEDYKKELDIINNKRC